MDKQSALQIMHRVVSSLQFNFEGLNDHNNVVYAWNTVAKVMQDAINEDEKKIAQEIEDKKQQEVNPVE